MDRSITRSAQILTAALLLAGSAGSALGQARDGVPMVADAAGNVAPQRFVERAGSMEFSGQMIVRPRQDRFGAEAARFVGGGMEQPAAFGRGLQPGVPLSAARARLLPNAVEHTADVDEYVVSIPQGMNENTFAEQLMATGDYEYAEPNWTLYTTNVPNDPQFNSQWHHDNMFNVGAWLVETGSPDVIVAIVDTGIDIDHPDLDDRLVPGFNAVTNLPQTSGGLVDDTQVSFGHGTFCAGMAAAEGDNGFGTVGVAWDVSLMPVKVTVGNSRSASLADLTQGARWAADNGARVVNVSFSGVGSSSFQSAGAYVENLGGVYIQSAGNDGLANLNFQHENVIVVGATSINNARAGFSNTGPGLDIVAPGNNVLCSIRGGGTTISSGTSFSAPAVAGVAALMFSANPDLTPELVRNILYTTTTDLGSPGEDNSFGTGLVNAAAAVAIAANTDVPTPPVITTEPSNFTLCEFASGSTTVTAEGTDLQYQWTDLAGTPIPGQTSPTLTITNAMASDDGIYRCTISNALDSVDTQPIRVTVDELPTVTQQPASQTVTEGDPVTFTADADDAESLQWQLDGVSIPGATGATLTIAAATLGDAGSYTFVASNGCGEDTSSPATLTVEPASSDCVVDVNEDGTVDGGDFFAWVNAFSNNEPGCDQNGDDNCDQGDFFAFVANFSAGCP